MTCPYCGATWTPGGNIIGQILHRAHHATDLPPRVIRGPERMQRTAYTRFAVMRAARDAGLSLTRIAEALDRDHSTVLYGIKRANEIAATDPSFRALIAQIAWQPNV